MWEILSAVKVGFLDPFSYLTIPLDVWAEAVLNWLVANFRDIFLAMRLPIHRMLVAIAGFLQSVPPLVMLIVVWLSSWQLLNFRSAVYVAGSMACIGLIGAWSDAMTTLSIILAAVSLSIAMGIPAGILAARSNLFEGIIRPLLDAMQTTPSFVYLVPIVMLFGIGDVSGVIVTIIYALPPLIRLTNLGIRQVSPEVIEAARAFGASPRQMLFKVQLPLAMKTIMAGVNQTLMMALGMVVVASMIAVTGLGFTVLRGISSLDMGVATIGGTAIVLLAIAIDRFTQGIGAKSRERRTRRWYTRGPAGFLFKAWQAASGTGGFRPGSRVP
jgi:glycine betaine/proline transport system permease protein